ncbi:MAG: hypothetical protein LBQ97_09845 [Fusobacteriaceae bacterium]|nr:hypothetical protein [Fusobacteriaceae bacterium]
MNMSLKGSAAERWEQITQYCKRLAEAIDNQQKELLKVSEGLKIIIKLADKEVLREESNTLNGPAEDKGEKKPKRKTGKKSKKTQEEPSAPKLFDSQGSGDEK